MYKFINKSFALIIVALLVSAPRAQQATQSGSTTESKEDRIALHQALLDLTNPWTVMCIAAHPDDEDGTSLTVLRHKYGAHTVSVFSTFGEGGQNAIGPELYEELGAIRVRETMAAAEIQGSEPYFLGLKDFGFSKSADEAFKFWGHEEALRRLVLQIRELRPDVIITNHSVTNHDHGHHQATARLELEAFDAAADPARFPEQLKGGVEPWQVQRLFVRTGFGGGQANAAQSTDEAGLVTIDPNEQDQVRGTTYAEQALAALQKHATQGPWPRTVADMARFRNSPDGKLPMTRYRLTREAKTAAPLPADSHNVLAGLRLPDEIANNLTTPTIDGRPLVDFVDERERVLNLLLRAKKDSDAKQHTASSSANHVESYRSAQMTQRVNRALAAAAGLTLKIVPSHPTITRNTSYDFSAVLSNNGSLSPYVIATHSGAGENSRAPETERFLEVHDKVAYPVQPGKTDTLKLAYQAPQTAPITVPHSQHLYDGLLFTQHATMSVSLKINGVALVLTATTWFDVAPPVEIESIAPSPFVFTPANLNRPLGFKVRLVNSLNKPFKGEFGISSPTEHINEVGEDIALGAGEAREFSLQTNVIPVDTPEEKRTPRADFGSIVFSVHPTGSASVITDAAAHVVYADARVAPNLRVGYVRGFDFSLPHALAALGVESKELSVVEVKTADLQKYSTILIDNRAYESVPELIAANQRLLDYAKDGGTLVVFYHKSNEWNPDQRRNRPQLAPYPLTLSDARITDENAAITFSEADHPLLNFPNKIGQEDFGGWIQERGLYYPKDWDAHYHALLSASDPGEAPLKGGLLVADYGRGHYIYTSMVWYRQLRAGVPGGYRMFANMISYGHQ